MQAVVGSSTGQVPCVKWTRGMGQMVFDGLGGCGGWAAYVVYGMWHSAFGTYRRERPIMCSVRCGPRGVWLSGATLLTRWRPGRRICALAVLIIYVTVELQSVVFACVSGTTSHTAVGTQY
jgi:hypothetical protein